ARARALPADPPPRERREHRRDRRGDSPLLRRSDIVTRPFVAHYDEIYVDKDYGKDIRDFLALSGAGSAARLLEIGAGTGNQTLRLAAVAASVVAVEIDADFAAVASPKLAAVPNVTLHRGRLESLAASSFDAAAAFFHVLNYVEDLPAFAGAV